MLEAAGKKTTGLSAMGAVKGRKAGQQQVRSWHHHQLIWREVWCEAASLNPGAEEPCKREADPIVLIFIYLFSVDSFFNFYTVYWNDIG